MVKIAVLVSGGGTNLQKLIDAEERGEIKSGKISLVVASREGTFALERAKKHGIASAVVARKAFNSDAEFDSALLQVIKKSGIEVVVLAGFLRVLGKEFIAEYRDRIINIHPSLIPAFCGDGFYGLRVHEAALAKGVKITGATVHLVNEITDGGEILMQKAVEILPDDTAETLQRRVMEQAEWILLPRATEMLCAKINK